MSSKNTSLNGKSNGHSNGYKKDEKTEWDPRQDYLYKMKKDEGISTFLWRQQVPGMFIKNYNQDLLIASEGDNYATYTVNSNGNDAVYYFKIKSTTPVLHSSDPTKYKIAWTTKISNSNLIRVTLRQDNIYMCSLDVHSLNMTHGFFGSEEYGKRMMDEKAIGNVPELIEFSEKLESRAIGNEPKLYMTADHALAYPLIFNEGKDRTTLHIELKRNIKDLLRVIEYDEVTDKWIHVKPDKKHVVESIEGKLPIPRVIGRFARTDKRERRVMLNPEKDMYKTFIVKDFVESASSETGTYGTKLKASVSSPYPCSCIFWVAENITSTYINNHGNYTTDSEDLRHGLNPIRSTLFSNNEVLGADNTADECRHHLPTAPLEEGYNVKCYSYAPRSNQTDYTEIIEGLTLEAHILHPNMPEEDANINAALKVESREVFRLIVRAMILKKIIIEKDDKGEWKFKPLY